jgi:sugar lactone lactonase YvrE
MWDVSAWFGQSLDNKPYMALDSAGNLFVTDPEGIRVLEFSPDGKFLRGIGESLEPAGNFKLPAGIAIDSEDQVWVTDGAANRVMRFTLPPLTSAPPAEPALPQASPTGAQ